MQRWIDATTVIAYLRRTGNLQACEKFPLFSLARAILLDVTLGEYMIPKERREAVG